MSPAVRRALGGLAGAAAMIAAITVLSRVLGLVRWMLQANQVGARDIGDAYNFANSLPNVLFEVAAGGALAGALVPVLAGPVARRAADERARGEIERTVGAALGWTLAILVPLAALLAAFSGPISTLLAREHGAAQADLIRFFLLVFAVQVPMYGVAVLLYAVLQSHKRFFWPAFAPVMSSLTVIATYLAYGALAHGEQVDPARLDDGALQVLAWGTTLGVAAMCFPMLVPVRRLGLRLRLRWRFDPGVGKRLLALATAGIAGVAAQQLSALVVIGVTSSATGPYTTYLYAQQVYLLPYAVLVVPLATSTFPRLAARASTDDLAGFARMASSTTRGVLVAAAVGAAAVVAAAPAVATVFGALGDDPRVAAGMAATLTWMVPGLLGFAAMFHGSRALYSLERSRAAVAANVAGWGTVAVAIPVLHAVRLPGDDVLVSIGAGSTLGMLTGGAVALVALRRAAGSASVHGLPKTLVVLALGGTVAAVAGRWVCDAVQELAGDGVATAVGAGAGAAVLAAVVLSLAVLLADRRTLTEVLAVERAPVPAGAADEVGDPNLPA